MMTEDLARAVESELADLAERLTRPRPSECLRCYLLRMVTEFGCDGTYRWTVRWRDMRAAQPGGMLRQLERRGGLCDCEVVLNVFPAYPQTDAPLPCAGVGRPGSWRPCNPGSLRRTA